MKCVICGVEATEGTLCDPCFVRWAGSDIANKDQWISREAFNAGVEAAAKRIESYREETASAIRCTRAAWLIRALKKG